ncbi:MAG: sigma-70 family RNA polymerase sigma factor [Kiloniellales bacterium]|nr:sigma-70 family RNA polymerase sigma factor [Kiloniellales bacterium]
MSEDRLDLKALTRGDKRAWDRFVAGYARVVFAAVQKRLGGSAPADEVDDVAQEVFLRLCKADYRLLRAYDPRRAAVSTWLTVIATSAAIDHLRRRKPPALALDAVPEDCLAEAPRLPARVRIPAGLLSPRQALVLELLYRRDLEVAEAAVLMGVRRQTVRSMHNKALVKLRAHFRAEDPEIGG